MEKKTDRCQEIAMEYAKQIFPGKQFLSVNVGVPGVYLFKEKEEETQTVEDIKYFIPDKEARERNDNRPILRATCGEWPTWRSVFLYLDDGTIRTGISSFPCAQMATVLEWFSKESIRKKMILKFRRLVAEKENSGN